MLAQIAPALPLGLLATFSPCVLPMYPGFTFRFETIEPALHDLSG